MKKIKDYNEFVEELEYIETWVEFYHNGDYKGMIKPDVMKVIITEDNYCSSDLDGNDFYIFTKIGMVRLNII